MRHLISVVLFFTTFIYAYIRYILYGPYSFPQDFFHILNKSLSFTSAILLFLIVLNSKNLNRKVWGKTLFWFVNLHIILSLILFFQGYYDKKFSQNALKSIGSVFWGLLAYFYLIKLFFSIKKGEIQPGGSLYFKKIGLLLMLLLLHVIFWGLNAWFQPRNWYGQLFPITLISAIIILTGLIYLFLKRHYFNRQ